MANSTRRSCRLPHLWLVRALIVLGSILVIPLGLEVAFRLFGPFLPGNYSSGIWLQFHPTYGSFHIPNYDGWYRSSEFATRIRLNSLGLRDHRTAYDKPPDTRRILMLGDSFALAAEVEQRDTMAEILDAGLRERFPDSNVEVINAGVFAWGTTQQLLYLEQEGHRFQPDVILLLFCVGNDVQNNYYGLEAGDDGLAVADRPFFAMEGGEAVLHPRVAPPREASALVRALRGCCRAYNVLETGVIDRYTYILPRLQRNSLAAFQSRDRGLYQIEPSDTWRAAWRTTELILKRLRDRAVEVGAPLVVVMAPASAQVDRAGWMKFVAEDGRRARQLDIAAPNRRLRDILGRLGIPHLDLLPAFQREWTGDRRQFYFEYDSHWNEAGNRLAAREAEQLLASFEPLTR
jgi:hypothetical protein